MFVYHMFLCSGICFHVPSISCINFFWINEALCYANVCGVFVQSDVFLFQNVSTFLDFAVKIVLLQC